MKRATSPITHILALKSNKSTNVPYYPPKHLQRLIIFGSYVTAKSDPNDVDVVLVMEDTFHLEDCPIEARGLFDHALAQARYGISIFWMRPGLLINESLEDFIKYWQTKRDGSKRGIVEVRL